MRRTRAGTRARQSADASTLVKMARRLSESGSRIEDQLWQRRLIELINERLARRNDDAIESALDELASSSQRAYDDLADMAESCAESTLVDIDGRPHDVLLLTLPLLAWSRYRLPTTTLSAGVVESLDGAVVRPPARARRPGRDRRPPVLDRPVAGGVLRRAPAHGTAR